MMNLQKRLISKGPKRILSLDGGGERSLITLGFLKQLEHTLRERHEEPDLRLCDYFDLIGGTSTGAILAAALSLGMSVDELWKPYQRFVKKVYASDNWNPLKWIRKKKPLEREIDRLFSNIPIGSSAIKTGLCITAKRADTNTTVLFMNHPRWVHYSNHKDRLLALCVQASAVLPNPFKPVKIDFGIYEPQVFIDGGISMANNPALQLFLLAVLQAYPFRWQTGEKQLLLVSIGAGFRNQRFQTDQLMDKRAFSGYFAQIPRLMMDDASWQAQLILQYISKSKTSWEIKKELGNLMLDRLTPEPALTYLRYDIRLESDELQRIGISDIGDVIKSPQNYSSLLSKGTLEQIGTQAAMGAIINDHFPPEFDVQASEEGEDTEAEGD